MEHIYDMIVVGGGPGGYTAALYGARAGLDTLVLEKAAAGGQMALTHRIDNYPGFEEGVEGYLLGQKMRKQAERFGAGTEFSQVNALELEGDVKAAETDRGTFRGRTLVLATGAEPRDLGLPGEQELTGRGVHYCAACDGMFYRGKTVAVIGGGNSAAGDALTLSRLAQRVILVHRRNTLRAGKTECRQLEQAENVKFCWNRVVTEILRGDKVTGLRLRDVNTGEETEISVDGVFVSIGRKPASELVRGRLELDENGYVAADETTRTGIPGVFAVGDLRTKALRQVVTALSDGAAAAHFAEEYLAGR